MFNNFGKILRSIREKEGYGLNQFAKKIGVSPAYLSNLETGKSDTIKLQILEKLTEEFHLFSGSNTNKKVSEFTFRTDRAMEKLTTLVTLNPRLANFLLETIEQGIELTDIPSKKYNGELEDYHLQ